jgi:hypothetical protein
MIDAAIGEVTAHGQPAVTRADDDGGHPQHDTSSQLISTATATGLVKVS